MSRNTDPQAHTVSGSPRYRVYRKGEHPQYRADHPCCYDAVIVDTHKRHFLAHHEEYASLHDMVLEGSAATMERVAKALNFYQAHHRESEDT